MNCIHIHEVDLKRTCVFPTTTTTREKKRVCFFSCLCYDWSSQIFFFHSHRIHAAKFYDIKFVSFVHGQYWFVCALWLWNIQLIKLHFFVFQNVYLCLSVCLCVLFQFSDIFIMNAHEKKNALHIYKSANAHYRTRHNFNPISRCFQGKFCNKPLKLNKCKQTMSMNVQTKPQ